jgi:hypothetical protein
VHFFLFSFICFNNVRRTCELHHLLDHKQGFPLHTRINLIVRKHPALTRQEKDATKKQQQNNAPEFGRQVLQRTHSPATPAAVVNSAGRAQRVAFIKNRAQENFVLERRQSAPTAR